jgi:pre-mRNA-processing factor 17
VTGAEKSPDRWRAAEMKCVRSLWGHTRGVTALNVWHSSNTTYLLSGSHDTKIRLWDLSRDCKCVAQLEGHRVTVWSIETDPHSPTVFSGAGDGTVKVWRIDDTPRCEATLQHGDGKVYCLLWTGGQSDQGRQSLLYSGAYQTLKLWDVASETAVQSWSAHQDCIWGIKSIGPDTFVTASEDRTVALWDKRHHSLVKRLVNKEPRETEAARALSVAVGGGYIFVGSDDCKIRVFDQQTYAHVTTLMGHSW